MLGQRTYNFERENVYFFQSYYILYYNNLDFFYVFDVILKMWVKHSIITENFLSKSLV